MMLQLTTKMEINVTARTLAADIGQLSTFIIKNRIPAVVTDSQFLETLTLDRLKFGGGRTGRLAYKIICAVDFPRGKAYALEKLRNLPENVVFLADGFDILLTGGRTDKEVLNELRGLSEFLKKIDPTKELRWTLGCCTRNRVEIKKMLTNMVKYPGSFIRTDQNLESQVSVDDHLSDIEFIRKVIATPVKVSGNVDYNTMQVLAGSAERFDVTLAKARTILKEAKRHKIPVNSDGEESEKEELEKLVYESDESEESFVVEDTE
jgi:hypothetical protein